MPAQAGRRLQVGVLGVCISPNRSLRCAEHPLLQNPVLQGALFLSLPGPSQSIAHSAWQLQAQDVSG